jgi:hypothetical protein
MVLDRESAKPGPISRTTQSRRSLPISALLRRRSSVEDIPRGLFVEPSFVIFYPRVDACLRAALASGLSDLFQRLYALRMTPTGAQSGYCEMPLIVSSRLTDYPWNAQHPGRSLDGTWILFTVRAGAEKARAASRFRRSHADLAAMR